MLTAMAHAHKTPPRLQPRRLARGAVEGNGLCRDRKQSSQAGAELLAAGAISGLERSGQGRTPQLLLGGQACSRGLRQRAEPELGRLRWQSF